MTRAGFLARILAAIPFADVVFRGAYLERVAGAAPPTEDASWDDLDMPESWVDAPNRSDVGWEIASPELRDGRYHMRCRTVDGVTEWSLLDGNGREVERWEGVNEVRVRTPKGDV